ncbi:uncharacterized protein LOC105688218 isoform X2 [Athalia rosae]|uniref:uncharacterized protein LOC105688218 isoform X2 n=1 Tax=Athalia rosae TaxID=37344 RepID=UPI0020343728|nr:uncharacterized protein LOC105688218 isoform X2 [Athalia rosae]
MLMSVKFYSNVIEQKSFKTWKCYTKHKILGRKLKYKSDFFYTMRLKQRALNALLKHVAYNENKKLAAQKFQLFYQKVLIKTAWNEWCSIIDEDKDDLQLRYELSSVISFYKRRIVTRTQRRIGKLHETALIFRDKLVMRDTILLWIKSYNANILQKRQLNTSVLHYENKIISKCFCSWINFCNENIRAENLFREASEYYSEILQQKMLKKLLMNVARKKIKQRQVQIAKTLHDNNVLCKLFVAWREYYWKCKGLRDKLGKCDRNMRKRLKTRILVHWKLYVRCRKCSISKLSMSTIHYSKKICAEIILHLKSRVQYKKGKSSQLNYLKDRVEAIKFSFKLRCFQQWRLAHLHMLKEKSKMFYAAELHESNFKRKYFLVWNKFLIRHKLECKIQAVLYESVKSYVLKNWLMVWYRRYRRSLDHHQREKQAAKIHEMKIQQRCYITWKCFCDIQIREKNDINHAKDYYWKLVVKEGLQSFVKLYLQKTEFRFETHLRYITKNSCYEYELRREYFNKWRKAVSSVAKNCAQMTKNQNDGQNLNPTRTTYFNENKSIPHLTPRYVIPKFMKDEAKLHFGIAHYSDYKPVGNVREGGIPGKTRRLVQLPEQAEQMRYFGESMAVSYGVLHL